MNGDDRERFNYPVSTGMNPAGTATLDGLVELPRVYGDAPGIVPVVGVDGWVTPYARG